MSFKNVLVSLSLLLVVQRPFGLCQAVPEAPASAEVVANDVIFVPVQQDALNDVVLTNLPTMIPDQLMVYSSSQIAPTGIRINTDNVKILGTMAVTNGVTVLDVPIIDSQVSLSGENFSNPAEEVASSDLPEASE